MGRLFSEIYNFFYRHTWSFVVLLLLLLGFIGYFGAQINLEEDINKVIPASEKNRELITVLEHSNFADRMIFCLSLSDQVKESDPGILSAYAASLIDSLEGVSAGPYVDKVEAHYGLNSIQDIYGLFYDQLPLFLDSSDYLRLSEKLTDTAIKKAIKNNYEVLLTPAGFTMREMILKDPLNLTFLVLEKLQKLKINDNFILYQDHIFTRDKRNLLFFVIPAHPATETSENARLVELLSRFENNLNTAYDGQVKLSYFGSAVVSVGNANQIKRDIMITVGLAAIVLIIFLGWYFRKKSSLILLFIPALLGGGTAIALLAIIKPEVSAISLGLGSVMLGIAIDYALHLLSHFRQSGNIKTVIRDISGSVMISSLTTASAFLCLMILRSEALRDLGLFAAFSVFSSAIYTLVILPQFFRKEITVEKNELEGQKVNWLIRLAGYPFHHEKKLGWLVLLLLIIFLYTSRFVRFEGNMDKMNYMSEELHETENFLDSISDYKLRSVFLVSTAGHLDSALNLNEKILPVSDSLLRQDIVKDYVSVHHFYPSSALARDRIHQWQEFWSAERKQAVVSTIIKHASSLRFKEDAFYRFYELLDYQKAFDREKLEPVREAFLQEYISSTDSLALVTALARVEAEEKAKVYQAYKAFDELTIFDRQSLTSSFMEGLNDSFNLLIMVSLSVVFLILTLSFGRIELGIITFIPLLISWVWTMGIMGLLGIRFNIFNVVISTFIFGLGIDYAIFTLRGLMYEYQYGRKKLNTFKTAILLSGITTMVGIGVLIFAKHPALHSIAISAIIGILSVILVTFTLLPRLFGFLIRHEGRSRKWPVTLKDFIFSVNTVMIFFVGLILLDLATLILRYLIPLPLRYKKLLFHRMLSFSTWTIVYGSVNIKKIIWNREREDFKKPAIIICNHQSHLDTVLTIMQNPRMIILTNPWVHKSIFYRGFIRFADFFDVSEGHDELEEKIRNIIARGYSVLYFPEGTRSPDLEIGRFHQGAFHMAKKLDLDILPIISYGSGNVMPKYEPFLKTSPATITIMPRIKPGDPMIRESSLSTAKAFRKYYKREYAKIRKTIETPAFFRKKVIRNYLYRGPMLEWYMKVKIRVDDHYLLFHDRLPEHGAVTDIGCGYGFMSYMLQLMAPGRKITAYDFDQDKIETARHVALQNKNIEFIHADITKTELNPADGFLLIDVLHYLPHVEQENLIRSCIQQLNPGGCIIIRDANKRMKKKHRGTRISELFSTRIIGFNKTWKDKKKLFFGSKEIYLRIFSHYEVDVEIVDQTRLNSNITYIIRKEQV